MTKALRLLNFTPPLVPAPGDQRLFSPSVQRNGRAIVEALAPRFADAEGEVLEVGGGSGQHVALLAHAFPKLVFQPSDPDPAHRASIDAWRAHLGLTTVRPAVALDVSAATWPLEATRSNRAFRAVFCANVIHIAPWSVAEGLFAGAARVLAADGVLALYGPFRWRGRHISEGNAAFDQSLRARAPSWGVRDVDDLDQLAASCALLRIETIEMPANNHILIFERDGR